MLKLKINIKRWYPGGEKKESNDKPAEKKPIIFRWEPGGLLWNELIKNKQNNKNTNVQIEEVIEEKNEEIKMPILVQKLVKKSIEKTVNYAEENEKKDKKEQINKQKFVDYTYKTIMIALQALQKQNGWGGLLIGLYNLWKLSPKPIKAQIIKNVSPKAVLSVVTYYIVKKPYFMFMKLIGRNKWKMGAGSLGTGTGLELVKNLNEQGASLFHVNDRTYIVNSNVHEVINQQIEKLQNNGVIVNNQIVEDLLQKGQAVILNKNTLEPMIQSFSEKKKHEILNNVDFFGDNVPTNYVPININEIPSTLTNPVGSVKKISEYTDSLIDIANTVTPINNSTGLVVFIVVLIAVLSGGYLYKVKNWDLDIFKGWMTYLPWVGGFTFLGVNSLIKGESSEISEKEIEEDKENESVVDKVKKLTADLSVEEKEKLIKILDAEDIT